MVSFPEMADWTDGTAREMRRAALAIARTERSRMIRRDALRFARAAGEKIARRPRPARFPFVLKHETAYGRTVRSNLGILVF